MAEFSEIVQKRKEMCDCYASCYECPLFRKISYDHELDCEESIFQFPQEAEKIIMDWKKPVDWNKVEVDTPILIKSSEDDAWAPRHFAKYEQGKVFAWNYGKTSWSADNCKDVCSWEYAKLAEEGEQDEQR